MIKETLKEKEPVAYASLHHDLLKHQVAHSYLFYGELNPLKKDVAFLLAQSIIENKDDFACEECETCKRIIKGNYFDVIYLDGYIKTIVKADVERIIEEFSKTGLEKAGKRVYIINNINNASPKVLNMILKFMEEPNGEDIYGIFITDDLGRLLPTVVSRCQKIPFKTKDFSYLIKAYQAKGFNYGDAYLLSNIKHELIEIASDDENYMAAKEFVYKTIENNDNTAYLPILFGKELYKAVDKDKFKSCTDYFFAIMLKLLNDSLNDVTINDEEYMYYVKKIQNDNLTKWLEIFLEAENKTKSGISINRQLLFDQIASKIILY